VLVVEGKARAVLSRVPADGPVEVVAAPGEGDDTIADLAGRLPGRRFVVTADRELRRRCVAAGAAVAGPRWLTGLLAQSAQRV
jgi:rRNA-processing protein FCF1